MLQLWESSQRNEIFKMVMYKLGVFGKDDYFQSFTFRYSIRGINGNTIVLFDSENNEEYNVLYSIGNDEIELKLVNDTDIQ
ncbi:MAG: hypothetical protein BWY74_02876 [Firmicutes bacterium ADurb.Bin419]|nr:MAG: hypothetical protein BWY74_02876 [Firmicutes bacterium ADurb.Bin419]